MQLDKTRIAIRERGLLEIYDLSLLVTKAYWGRLLLAIGMAVVPLSILNAMILWPLEPDLGLNDTANAFVTLMLILIVLEAPLATIPVTLLLGDVLFHDQPDWKRMFQGFRKAIPRLFWTVAILRGVLPGMLMIAVATYLDDSFIGMSVLLFLLCLGVTILRTVRPYIGEIIVLEKNPLRSRNLDVMTIGRRSAALHNPNFGDMVVRAMASSISILLFASVLTNIWGMRGYLFGMWDWDRWFLFLWLPLATWLVVLFMGVVRFLSYLDLRIRREGWEVELVVRAEANRLREVAA